MKPRHLAGALSFLEGKNVTAKRIDRIRKEMQQS
nr:MAG TPA: hypothetical protein [Caudoviricetes sp.]